MNTATTKKHIHGLDYLRATMAALVVVWHMGGVGRSRTFSPAEYGSHGFSISDLLNFHVLLLAVPTFMLISCFLYIRNGADAQRLAGRFKRLLALLVFWPLAFNLFRYGFFGFLSQIPSSAPEILRFGITAGDTVFYFFVSLLICTVLSHLIAKWNALPLIAGFLFCLFLLPLASFLAPRIPFPQLSAYWNPLNFLVYPFLAVLIFRYETLLQTRNNRLLIISVALMAAFSVIEWKFLAHEAFFITESYGIPAYTRASLVFGSIALLSLSYRRTRESPPLIRFAAKYSLGVYCLHPFLIDLARMASHAALGATIASNCVSPILVIGASYLLAVLLKKYFFQEHLVV